MEAAAQAAATAGVAAGHTELRVWSQAEGALPERPLSKVDSQATQSEASQLITQLPGHLQEGQRQLLVATAAKARGQLSPLELHEGRMPSV